MKILITGAKGFVGRNLAAQLSSLRDSKCSVPGLQIDEIYEYDIDSSEGQLNSFCRDCDFVFHFAGVNRPLNQSEFVTGNVNSLSLLLNNLKKCGNKCPVMLSSSIQASEAHEHFNSNYSKSKLSAEELLFQYARQNTVKALVYRFPNVFGKWCRPNYNSAVATFCNNIANDLPIKVDNRNTELELLYIDDLVNEMILALQNKEHRCCFVGVKPLPDSNGDFCYVPQTYHVSLGQIVDWLHCFKSQPETLIIPEIPSGSFQAKLYSAFLSYLPKNKIAFPLKMNLDSRGSFTELLKSEKCGQVSVSVSKPGVVRGQHWHNSKWELFIVVSGRGMIQQRKIGTDKIIEFEVSGEKIEAVHMLPGYTHNIINLSQTEDLVTVMWANEPLDQNRPDTIKEPVVHD